MALAVLMPIVASMGGNAGTQALTVTVRAIATHNLGENLRRSSCARGWSGCATARSSRRDRVSGALLRGRAARDGDRYRDDRKPGGRGFAGALVPIGLEKLGADPALASGTFVTTMTDVFGFFAFLGLATVLLL